MGSWNRAEAPRRNPNLGCAQHPVWHYTTWNRRAERLLYIKIIKNILFRIEHPCWSVLFFKSGRRFASSRCEHVFDLHWPYARNRTRTRRNMLCPCLFSLRSFWRWVQASYLVLRFVNLWRVGSKSFRVCPCNILQPLESGGCVELPPCLQVTLIGCQKAPRAPCRALVGRLRRKQLPEVSPVESQFFR